MEESFVTLEFPSECHYCNMKGCFGLATCKISLGANENTLYACPEHKAVLMHREEDHERVYTGVYCVRTESKSKHCDWPGCKVRRRKRAKFRLRDNVFRITAPITKCTTGRRISGIIRVEATSSVWWLLWPRNSIPLPGENAVLNTHLRTTWQMCD
jgi:hypothetical protein